MTGPEGLGLLLSAIGAGALLGMGLMVAFQVQHLARLIVTVGGVYAVLWAAAGLSPWLFLSVILLFALGTADGVWSVSRNTLAQLLVPDALRGRAMSVVMLVTRGGSQLGTVQARPARRSDRSIGRRACRRSDHRRGCPSFLARAPAAACRKPCCGTLKRVLYSARSQMGRTRVRTLFTPAGHRPASPLLHLFSALLFAMLFMHGADAAPAASQDEWRIDPLRGPVDLGLTDPSLIGAIDVHLHLDPDSPGRRRRGPRHRRVRRRQDRDRARHARLCLQDPSGHELRERRLHGAHACVADLRGFRPHGVELFDRRDQRGDARALHADQGRLGPHL